MTRDEIRAWYDGLSEEERFEAFSRFQAHATEWKTLKQIWDKVGGQFHAIDERNRIFFVAGISPRGTACGWDEAADIYVTQDNYPGWKLYGPDPWCGAETND